MNDIKYVPSFEVLRCGSWAAITKCKIYVCGKIQAKAEEGSGEMKGWQYRSLLWQGEADWRTSHDERSSQRLLELFLEIEKNGIWVASTSPPRPPHSWLVSWCLCFGQHSFSWAAGTYFARNDWLTRLRNVYLFYARQRHWAMLPMYLKSYLKRG